MNKIALFGSIVALLFLASCGPKITKEQEERLNELTANIDSIASQIATIDSVKSQKMTSDFFAKKNYLQIKMTDTISRDILFKLDEFVQLRKGMGYLQGEYSGIAAEAKIMQQQMEDLNHDVESGLIEEKQFEKYYELEKTNFDKLKFAAERLVDVNERMHPAYNKQVVFIDSLINAHKAKLND